MTEPWKLRFMVPTISQVRWATAAPDRLGVISTESGVSQAWAWSRVTGERRLVSGEGIGAEEVHVTPDGGGIVWWLDPQGDERGRWMVTPFEGGEAHPLLDGIPDGWQSGISIVPGWVAAGFAWDEDYSVIVQHDAEPPRELYRHAHPSGVGQEWPQGPGGLSADGSLVCIRHAEDGDIVRMAVRVLDTRSGDVVGELRDEAETIAPAAWSPVPGDQRLVLIREVSGRERPWMWDLATGELDAIEVDAPGALFVQDWFPDAGALLLRQDHEARDTLLRVDLANGATSVVVPTNGTISVDRA